MSSEKLFSLGELATALGATLHGDATLRVRAIRPLDEAKEGDLTFFAPSKGNQAQKLRELAERSSATALLVKEHSSAIRPAQIVVPNPVAAMIQLAVRFFDHPPRPQPGIHPTAVVSETATIGAGVRIGAYTVIGERVTIGDGSILHPHVIVYDDARIGRDCVLHAGAIVRERTVLGDDCLVQNGAVLGSDGFGYIPDPGVGHHRIPHLGSLTLGSHVDIGTNTAIDRATLGTSILGQSTKVDNLVQIGHNAKIGRRVLLCGQVGIAGSCEIGDDVVLGGAVGVADHIRIGSRSRVSARSGIASHIPEGVDMAGYPASTVADWRRESVALRKLPQLLSEIRSLRKELNELREQVGEKSAD